MWSKVARISSKAWWTGLQSKRLESWKQIAAYMDRHVTTVRRWEKRERLPVHRHAHTKLDSVCAYSAELDAWIESRKPDRSGTPSPNATLGAPVRSGSLPPPPSLSGLPSWPVGLLGRAREIELLEKAWTGASRGQQQVLLISGDPGQGKTRLALEFARSVAQRATVLLAACDREALIPFASRPKKQKMERLFELKESTSSRNLR